MSDLDCLGQEGYTLRSHLELHYSCLDKYAIAISTNTISTTTTNIATPIVTFTVYLNVIIMLSFTSDYHHVWSVMYNIDKY